MKAPEDEPGTPPAPADTEPTSPAPAAVTGLTDARTIALERYAIRTRENGVTRAAWRLEVESAEGPGTIVCVDAEADQTHYRGEGVFLGWPRERLEAAYFALRPVDSSPRFELNQLG
jgi:hypothetical protein